MKKLLKGIADFRNRVLPSYRETFARLALGQSPDCLFIACSDSRVVPNLFASSDPGDLFVVRNVGNLIPVCQESGITPNDRSAGAAIEFAVTSLEVSNVIICGHSECGAMRALLEGREKLSPPNLQNWLAHGEESVERWRAGKAPDKSLSAHNQLSQLNVLQQIEHVMAYPMVQERIRAGKLRVHGWWFDIAKADVYAYEEDEGCFSLLDEAHTERIITRL
ncbi:MAG: carbonic anhydrase [Myxococcota bacterium]